MVHNVAYLSQLIIALCSLGGNVSQTDNQEHNGQGGSSYTSPDAIDTIFEPGV